MGVNLMLRFVQIIKYLFKKKLYSVRKNIFPFFILNKLISLFYGIYKVSAYPCKIIFEVALYVNLITLHSLMIFIPSRLKEK